MDKKKSVFVEKRSVCVIGSGNWGTGVGKILAENAAELADMDERVNIFVYDEVFEGRRISEVINQYHVNAKYLPNLTLPENLVACTDLVETARYADIIVFVMPHQFIEDFCKTLLGKIKPSATAVSLIKGFTTLESGGIELISRTIMKFLKIPCSTLMGVNLASEIALNRYCEATIGCRDLKLSKVFHDLFSTKLLRVSVIDDADCVEVIGYMKHMIAFGSGILDGLESNENTRSALLRFSINEVIRYVDFFYPGCKLSTLIESCGLADILTVCYGSKNRRFGEALVKSGQTVQDMEMDYLGGEKLWGPLTAKGVHFMLQSKGLIKKFPIFDTIYKICQNEVIAEQLIETIETIPNIIFHPTHLFPL